MINSLWINVLITFWLTKYFCNNKLKLNMFGFGTVGWSKQAIWTRLALLKLEMGFFHYFVTFVRIKDSLIIQIRINSSL